MKIRRRQGPAEGVSVHGLNETVEALAGQGVRPVWTVPDWQSWRQSSLDEAVYWRTADSLIENPSTRDPKHAHPLNLLRLYLAEVPALQRLDRVLLLDDDASPKSRKERAPRDVVTSVAECRC